MRGNRTNYSRTRKFHKVSGRPGVVHAVAKCDDCGWEAGNYRNAQALGKLHAMQHGHTVRVEVGIACTYRPEGETDNAT